MREEIETRQVLFSVGEGWWESMEGCSPQEIAAELGRLGANIRQEEANQAKDMGSVEVGSASAKPKSADSVVVTEIAGKSLADAKVLSSNQAGGSFPVVFSAAELERMEFAPLRWIVPNLLPAGLTLLAGTVKAGKTKVMTHVAVEVATGGKVFERLEVEPAGVLYLCLEDGWRRVQDRMRGLCANGWPKKLYFVNKWPTMDKGGLDELSAWLEDHREVKLVIIDILAKFRWPKQRGENFYDWDYRTATAIKDVADKQAVAAVVLHHTNKLLDSPDIYLRISGSQGLAAGADTLALLERQDRAQREAQLALAGREVEGQELIIQYDPDSGGWRLLGDAGLYNTSEERRQVLQFLEQCTMATPKEVAAGLGKNESTIRNMMRTMANSAQLAECGNGRYAVPRMR